MSGYVSGLYVKDHLNPWRTVNPVLDAFRSDVHHYPSVSQAAKAWIDHGTVNFVGALRNSELGHFAHARDVIGRLAVLT